MDETEELRQRQLEQERSLSDSNAARQERNFQPSTGPLDAPGTLRGNEIRRREDQQGFVQNVKDGFFGSTALGAASEIISDEAALLEEELFEEGTLADTLSNLPVSPGLTAGDILASAGTLLGFRAGESDYDPYEQYDALTEGVPYGYHDEIVGNDNYDAALRARERILNDLDRGRRLGNQQGFSGNLAVLAGSLVDVDLPLTFVTGGGFGAARVARAGVKFSNATKLSTRAANTVESGIIGASAGLQAGLASGAGQLAWKDTADWTILAETAITSTLLGGSLNAAVRGDLGLKLQAARDELHARIATDDANLTGEGLNVEGMRIAPLVIHADSTVGAAVADGAAPNVSAERINRDVLDSSPRLEDITTASENWRHESGWLNRKREGENEFLEKFVTRGFGASTAKDYASLYRSESPTANFLAGAIFESPHGYGRGRATAAVLNDHYTKQIVEPTFEAQRSLFRWAKRNKQTLAGSGIGVSSTGNRAFSREVMLEVNARRQGRQYSSDPDILAATEAYGNAGSRALDVAKGREGQRSLDGFENIQGGPYLPYRWNGRKLRDLIRKGTVDESTLQNALANSYKAAGLTAAKDADVLAKALITRLRSQADGVTGSLQDLTTADGRSFLEDALKDAGVSRAERASIVERITGDKNEAGKVSHAKSRNEIDLEGRIETTDGSQLQIVDLMDDDLTGSWQRYARQISGSSALARHGISNRASRESVISAIQREQAALGEPEINGDLIRAMLTHFDGGPISGFAFGRTNKGIGAAPALAKRLTNLSLLGKLGITQLGETGASMAAVGLKNWVDRGIMSRLDPERLAKNKGLLEDIAFITGRIGEDHHHFAPHLELDSLSAQDGSEFMSTIQGWAGKAQYVQGYTSLFNQVRTWQQTTAALGIADKVIKGIRDASDFNEFGFNRVLDEKLSKRVENDFGIDVSTMDYIGRLIDEGTIEIETKNGHSYVNKLNMDQWEVDIADEFGAAITRSTNQQVQKSLAGEQDAWINTEAASLLMHLKTFPMQAVTKQFARNMRYFDQENWGVLGMGLGTAYTALAIRDVLDGRERDAGERAKAAIGYSNMTGFIPMGVDPVLTMLGLEDRRFNQYGPHSEASVASLDVANRAMRIPGAAIDYATGNANGYDRQAMMAIPFMNTIGLSRLW